MNNKRVIYIILFFLFAFFSIKFFETAIRDYNITNENNFVLANVIENGNCGTSGGTIKVKYNDQLYTLGIGRSDCINANYSIGEDINVLYSKRYNYLILPDSGVKTGLIMSLCFFLFPLYCLIKIIKK
ncbi:MAG: hypothetical protein IPQ18_13400 [Saprospiraceae bacterium]|nr:hypothetical protein [Saprospiraceae bacterium]